MINQGKYHFLTFKNVVLRNFSLYKKEGKIYEVNEIIKEGVYCLAGANGLGKTTFLNAINYGLTGIVLEPDKEIFDPKDIDKKNKGYTERYFSGRIDARNIDKSEIELVFVLGDKVFRIIRSFKNREDKNKKELKLFEVYSEEDGEKIPLFNSENPSFHEINEQYEIFISKEIGFENFDFFVFYQLYVFTFDENRRMIFWDPRASKYAYSIAFNADLKDTERIINLQRKMDKLESDAKNDRWQATQTKNKIENLRKDIEVHPNIEKLRSDFDEAFKNHQESQKLYENIKTEYDTLLKSQSYLNSEIMQLKMEHTRLFSRYSKPRSKLLNNTYVELSIEKKECLVCSSKGEHIVDNIERNIHKDNCPLCNTIINEENSDEQKKILKEIEANDKKINEKNDHLERLIHEVNRKKIEAEKAEYEFIKSNKNLNKIKTDHPNISLDGTGDDNIDSLIKHYMIQFKEFDEKAKSGYKRRDEIKPEYEQLLNKVGEVYRNAEIVFVPIFKQLAKSFIGLDLNIAPDGKKGNFNLVLTLNDTARTESFQLSESQRFFLDIALRMSLSIYLSSEKSPTTMLIDTPEGSLDIAYESRVGKMFSEFTEDFNQNILMTANINASQLLISLAENTGKERMKFRRMLDWTDLTVVQKEGEHLFEGVYKNVEIAMNKKK